MAYQARADGSFAATYRVDTKDIPEEYLPEHPGTADASLRLEASAGTASWQVSGNAEGAWTNQPAEGLDRFEGGNYLATVRAGGLTGQIGQVDPQLESSIISSFQRRGAKLDYLNRGQQLQASGFALRTVPVAGFHEGTGLGDPENRVLGGALTLRPLSKHAEWLTLTGIYLVGKQGADPGVAVLDQTGISDGERLERRARQRDLQPAAAAAGRVCGDAVRSRRGGRGAAGTGQGVRGLGNLGFGAGREVRRHCADRGGRG